MVDDLDGEEQEAAEELQRTARIQRLRDAVSQLQGQVQHLHGEVSTRCVAMERGVGGSKANTPPTHDLSPPSVEILIIPGSGYI